MFNYQENDYNFCHPGKLFTLRICFHWLSSAFSYSIILEIFVDFVHLFIHLSELHWPLLEFRIMHFFFQNVIKEWDSKLNR